MNNKAKKALALPGKLALYKLAIISIESACEEKQLTFTLTYRVSKVVSKYHRLWRVDVMGQTFADKDFLQAVEKSYEFLLNGLYARDKKKEVVKKKKPIVISHEVY